jgi:DNA polymerase I-like protein with 3'-5' exonuclease and polymerase domains
MTYDFNEAYEFFTRFPEEPVLTVAIDNETTGIHLKHGDMPFMTAATFSNGEQWLWQAEVDPFTRQPLWSDTDLEELKALYQHRDWTYVMSNMKFDTRCAALLDPTLDVMDFLCRCHETIGEHHALKNNESHALKDAASKHAKISDDDEQELHDAVRQARKEAALLGWAIASPLACPQQRRRPKKGWEVMDMWVPRQLALHRWRTSEAGIALQAHLPPFELAKIKKMQGWEWHPPEVSPHQVHPWHTLCAKYCKQDTLRSYLVHKVFEKALREESLWEIYMEFRINTIVSYAIEENGVPFFPRKAQAFRKVLLGEAEYAKEVSGYALSSVYPFNPASPDKVRRVLYDMFGLPVTRLTKAKKRKDGTWSAGQPTTDKDFLATIIGFTTPEDTASLKPPTLIEDDRSGWKKAMMVWHKELTKDKENGKVNQLYIFCSALLQYSKANKNVSQIDAFLSNAVSLDNSDTCWLLPSINPYGTKTTRQSSSNPNGTNISKGGRNKKAVAHLWKNKQTLRTLFGPPQGFEWWSVDYNKIQPMIFAVMSKTDSLLQAMIRGEDPYEFLARIIFGHETNPTSPAYSLFDPTNDAEHSGHRDIGKTTLLAFLFGAGPAKIDQTAGMPGLYEILCNRLPSVIKFLEKKEFEVIKRGYVETLGGYRLYVAEDKAYSGSVIAIQGTEGEIVKRAEYGIQHYLHKNNLLKRFYISLPVHDELNFITEKDFGQQHIGPVTQIMVDAAASFGVPCGVGIKYCPENWGKGIPWEEEIL